MKQKIVLAGLVLMTMTLNVYSADVLYRVANDYSEINLPMKVELTTSSPTGVRVFTTTPTAGNVKYNLELEEASEFKVEAYLLANSTTRNAIGVAVDGGPVQNWDLDVVSTYEWRTLPTVFYRAAGPFEIDIKGVDSYTRIAAVRIAKIAATPLAVSFTAPTVFNEGVPAEIVLTKIAGTEGNINYRFLRGKSNAIIASGRATFTAADTTKIIPITIPDDSVYDPEETRIKIQVTSATSVFVPFTDNDAPTALRLVSEPVQAYFGKALPNFAVELINANGDRVQDNSSVITANLKEAGILSGTKVLTFVNGLATFSNLKIINGNSVNKIALTSGSLAIDSSNIALQDFSPIDSDAEITTTLNATSFSNAVALAGTAAAGTRILVPDEVVNETTTLGSSTAHHNINAVGLAGKPVIIEALNAGGVVFTGKTKLKLSGKFLVFKGFKFLNIDPGANYGGSLALVRVDSCEYCAIRGVRMEGGPLFVQSGENDLKHFKWIMIGSSSSYTEISNSTFTGKRNAGSMILINRSVTATTPNGHRIYRNQFLDRILGNNNLNDFDVIRVGSSGDSLSPVRSVLDAANADVSFGSIIENNLFENINIEAAHVTACTTSSGGWLGSSACLSEPEVISIKSPQNIVRFNTFRKINGGLTLRHGFQNIVEGNYFYGAGTEGSYGIRVIGDTQVVMSNHLQDLKPQTSSSFKGSLVLVTGDADSERVNSGYWPVYDSILAFNFLTNNRRNFFVSANYSGAKKEDVDPIRSGFSIAPERNFASYNYVATSTSSSENIIKNSTPANYLFPLNEVVLFENSSFDQGVLGWPVTDGWSQLSGMLETTLVEETRIPLMNSAQNVYNNLKASEAKISELKVKQATIPNVSVDQQTRLGKLVDKILIRNGNLYESILPLSRDDVGSL